MKADLTRWSWGGGWNAKQLSWQHKAAAGAAWQWLSYVSFKWHVRVCKMMASSLKRVHYNEAMSLSWGEFSGWTLFIFWHSLTGSDKMCSDWMQSKCWRRWKGVQSQCKNTRRRKQKQIHSRQCHTETEQKGKGCSKITEISEFWAVYYITVSQSESELSHRQLVCLVSRLQLMSVLYSRCIGSLWTAQIFSLP